MSHPLKLQNIYLRLRGKEFARRHYGRLWLMSMMVMLIPTVLETLLTLLGDLVMASEITLLADAASQYAARDTIGSTQAMADALLALFSTPKFWLYNAVYLAILWLVTSGVRLGYTEQCLRTGKGEKPRILGVFGRMKHSFKALRLDFWISLKIGLWALPGMGMMLLGVIFAALEAGIAGLMLLLGGYALIFVLMIPAALRYSLSNYVLADHPEMGVRACVNESKFLMDGHKHQFFKLGMPCWFTMFGLYMAAFCASGMTLAVFGVDIYSEPVTSLLAYLGIMVAMLFMPRLNMIYTMFYLLRSDMARNASLPRTDAVGNPLPAESPESPAEPVSEPAAEINPETTDEKENPDEEPLC